MKQVLKRIDTNLILSFLFILVCIVMFIATRSPIQGVRDCETLYQQGGRIILSCREE